METLEKIKRRRRDTPQSDGGVNSPTERDLLIFQFIAEHGGEEGEGLPTSFLYDRTKDRWPCRAKLQTRLKWLYHRPSMHGEHYLEREDDYSTVEHSYEAIHKLTSASIAALEDCGFVLRRREIKQRRGSHPTSPHQFMIGTCGASMEIAAHHHPSINWMSRRQLLEDAPSHSMKFPCEIVDRGQFSKRSVIPDDLYEFEYLGDCPTYRIFAVECDRNNEPWTREALDESSYRARYLRYRELITGEQFSYKRHLNKRAGMLVLNIMSSEANKDKIKRRILEEFGPCRWMLFQTVPGFGRTLFIPKPMYQLLHTPWERAGYPPIDLTQPYDRT